MPSQQQRLRVRHQPQGDFFFQIRVRDFFLFTLLPGSKSSVNISNLFDQPNTFWNFAGVDRYCVVAKISCRFIFIVAFHINRIE